MNQLLIALGLGFLAACIDIIPMIVKKMKKNIIVSAFLHWMTLSVIIPFVQWGIPAWLKGLLIAELCAIPAILVVHQYDKDAFKPMLIFSAILGIALGIAGQHFIA